jgi:hypothetical protein
MTDNIANAFAFLSSPPQDFHTFRGLAVKHPYQHTHTSQRSRVKTEAAIDNHNLIRFYTAALARCKFLLDLPAAA